MNLTWRPCAGTDVPQIVALAQDHFEHEIPQGFGHDVITYARNLTLATVNQFYNPGSELLQVAVDSDNRVRAYVWSIRGERAAWSDDEMVCLKMAHVDMMIGTRDRIRLVTGMIALQEAWARSCGIAMVCSSTMRVDQAGFLALHARLGYEMRGSFAYKRLEA